MRKHTLKVYSSRQSLPKKDQLAWKLGELAQDTSVILDDVKNMVINRIIDNAGVAMACIDNPACQHARDQALAYPKTKGATLFGLPHQYQFSPEWAAWANGVAVRELDFHDTFLAEDYSHPADNIPPLIAVAQSKDLSGKKLLQAIVAAYEIHVSLVKGICLHKHKIDHIAHLCPAQVAGLAVLMQASLDETYQAIQQAVHVSFTTRQSRKGNISSWKAYAPAFSGKLAIEAMDRALRGECSPSPIYEGEDSVVAWMLDGKEAQYNIPLEDLGQPKQAILETYTKAHSAEYQSQAFIDLAFDLKNKIQDLSQIKQIRIHTSHHTHYVIGTGAGDPQKMSPEASRETLDHSLMYIFAVALEDGRWHHVDSYTKERAQKKSTIELWNKIETKEDPVWTKAYHQSSSPAFGGRVEITLKNGKILSAEKSVADAHCLGKDPYQRPHYIKKFKQLTQERVKEKEIQRFIDLAENLENLSSKDLKTLNVQADLSTQPRTKGIF